MYPQNGKIGNKGNLYQGTHQYRYFKEKFGVKKAGVVYYDNSAPSKNAGDMFLKALKAEGIEATGYPINVALPQYDSAVLDMKQRGITAVWDSIDISGNQNLCKSIDANGLVLKAKVSTISTWSQLVGEQFDAPCRNYIFSVEDPGALSYDQTSNPEIAKFRAAMKRYFPSREDRMFQWNVDGWGSAMWFADAAASCGANLTRACIEKYLNAPKGYTARGLWSPRNNEKYNFETKKTLYRCIQVAQWDDKAKSFVTRAAYPKTCYTTPYMPYPAPAS
jgi:branched-chain amino acid transport system substrate-binding protein